MKKLSISILFVILMLSCKQGPKTSDGDPEPVAQLSATSPEEGKKLMETKCYLCHNPSAPENGQRIGPPMVAVKAHYLETYKDKEAFVNGIMEFVKAPSAENTMMRGAVRRFGLMPSQQFPEEEIQKIAEYIYDYQIEEPDWFKEHWMDRRGDSLYNKGKKLAVTPTEESIEELGMKYALETKKVLGKNLMGTIQNKGVGEAVVFCNEKAYPLTDSMSTNFNARIKRVSDKPRNPNNKANAVELAHIETFKSTVAAGKSVEPILKEENGKVYFYYPIVTNTMCLNCHGTPEKEIAPEVLTHLSQLYPDDKAIGYGPDEVRGIWSIVFDASNNSN
ncbi:MAG: c-type heme family protein [Flagellimonas sp.]